MKTLTYIIYIINVDFEFGRFSLELGAIFRHHPQTSVIIFFSAKIVFNSF